MPSTSSLRLAEKRSLQDSYLAATNTACASFSNESICLEAERDDKKRIKVNVVSSCSEDDDDDDDTFNDDGKSELPSYIDDNNDNNDDDDVNDNDGNDDYVYDENDESNSEYDENVLDNIDNNLSKSIGACQSSRVDNDITEQGVEELLDSNAETIDPKKKWIKQWQCLPKVAINERVTAYAGDVLRIWSEACEGNDHESEYTSTRHTMGLPRPKGTTSYDFMMSDTMAEHLPNLLARMNVAFLERVFDSAFHMKSFTPEILLEIEDKGNVQFANCGHNASCYIRFLIYLREVWLKLFDFIECEFKLRETEIDTDIKNNKYTMSSVEHEIKHMNDVRLFMKELRPIIKALPPGTWYTIPYVGMTETQTFLKR
jgi:hypothetical protein